MPAVSVTKKPFTPTDDAAHVLSTTYGEKEASQLTKKAWETAGTNFMEALKEDMI